MGTACYSAVDISAPQGCGNPYWCATLKLVGMAALILAVGACGAEKRASLERIMAVRPIQLSRVACAVNGAAGDPCAEWSSGTERVARGVAPVSKCETSRRLAPQSTETFSDLNSKSSPPRGSLRTWRTLSRPNLGCGDYGTDVSRLTSKEWNFEDFRPTGVSSKGATVLRSCNHKRRSCPNFV